MSYKRTKEVEKHLSNIEAAKIYFEDLHSKKEDKLSSKSERWQESEKGQSELEDINSLEQIRDDSESLYDAISDLFEEG